MHACTKNERETSKFKIGNIRKVYIYIDRLDDGSEVNPRVVILDARALRRPEGF